MQSMNTREKMVIAIKMQIERAFPNMFSLLFFIGDKDKKFRITSMIL